ncbi:MAG: FMN-binding protein [Oscillospiraceae bacterium]|nr:FMN-binding protein [Oscillospiraceae bacterium]
MKDDFVMPILVLSLICLIFTCALAFTNSVTAPIIAQAALERENSARYELIPDADSFIPIEAEGLPSTIKEVYGTSNNVGYIFIVTGNGYGGEMRIICALDPNGTIMRSSVLQSSETKGLGSKVEDASFSDQFIGKSGQLEGVVAVSGATLSTNAYVGAIGDVFAAFEIIKGVS